jgi:hypothetical protein
MGEGWIPISGRYKSKRRALLSAKAYGINHESKYPPAKPEALMFDPQRVCS